MKLHSDEQKNNLAWILEGNRRHNYQLIKDWQAEASMSVGRYNPETKKGPTSWPSRMPRASAMLRYGVND